MANPPKAGDKLLSLIEEHLEDLDYEDAFLFIDEIKLLVLLEHQRTRFIQELDVLRDTLEDLQQESHDGAYGLSPAERNPGLR